MATKALNMKWDASELEEIKEVAKVFHMTITEFFKEAASLNGEICFRLKSSMRKLRINF